MSDEPFRRPGSGPVTHHPASAHDAAVWRADSPPLVRATPAPPTDVTSTPLASGRRVTLHGLVIGLAGLVAGFSLGAVLVHYAHPAPVSITRDTFPAELLGRQRDDLSTAIVDGLDSELQRQIEAYRFVYGGDGARFTYGTYALTIVNGHVPTVLPAVQGADDGESVWKVSLNSGSTRCVSESPSRDAPPPFELSELLDDDSKDVFFWLEQGRISARTQCVLFDEDRNLSIRVEGSGWVQNNLRTAGWFRDELDEIHTYLIG